MRRKISIVRALQRSILGRNCGASLRSISVQRTPFWPRSMASVSPTGPAPTIKTSVSAPMPVIIYAVNRAALILEQAARKIGVAAAWAGIPLMVVLACLEPVLRWAGLGGDQIGRASCRERV